MSTASVAHADNGHAYGARYLLHVINRNSVRGYVIAISALLLLLIGYVVYNYIEAMSRPYYPKVKRLITLDDAVLPPPPTDSDVPPPPPVAPTITSGPAARAGTPVPIPDADLAPDVKDFANVDQINRASTVGGDGIDYGTLPIGDLGAGVNITQRDVEPDMDEFIALEKEPAFDYEGLQKRVKYPDIARRNGIEGTVTVGVLIGTDGKIKKTQIISSDHQLFNDAAVKAVMETTFTAGIQNNSPTSAWVRIPIRFRLR